MKFDDFVSGITFRFLKPQSKIPPRYRNFSDFLNMRLDFSLEIFNTKFPFDDNEIKMKLREICKIPKFSTLALGAIINYGVRQLPQDQAFVNVGVWNGFTFLAGMLNNPEKICIGIDNFSEFGGPRQRFLERFHKMKNSSHFFYDMDYEKYFTDIHKERIGFYIYDGEHSYKNQLKGLQIVEPFLAENSIILVDDTNLDDPRKATIDFMHESKYQYKLIFDQRTYCNQHPTFWNGVIIIRKGAEK